MSAHEEHLKKLTGSMVKAQDMIYQNTICSWTLKLLKPGVWIRWVDPPKTRTWRYGKVVEVGWLGSLEIEEVRKDGTTELVKIMCVVKHDIRVSNLLEVVARSCR